MSFSDGIDKFNFDNLDEFDWSMTSPDFKYPDQPYLIKPRLKKTSTPVKSIRTGRSYETVDGDSRKATEEGKKSLARFRKFVLKRCLSSFGPFYQSCFDGLQSSNVEADDINLASTTASGKRVNKIEAVRNEIERKSRMPGNIDKFLVFNERYRSREGPACYCTEEHRRTGIHHSVFPGEDVIPKCATDSNNLDKLHHYVLKVNKLSKGAHLPVTFVEVDNEVYYFEGFSLFLHEPLSERFPPTSLNQCYEDFEWELVKAPAPTHFTIDELEAFHDYLFGNILEIFDVNRFGLGKTWEDSCPFYHCYPRFAVTKNKESRILSMADVLICLRRMFVPVDGSIILENVSEQLLLNPEKRPKTLRVDSVKDSGDGHPYFVHTTVLPTILFSSRDPDVEAILHPKHGKGRVTRAYHVKVNAKGYFKTGLFPDLAIHGLHVLAAVAQIRIRRSLAYFEDAVLKLQFENPILLELALMNPSFKAAYGANSSHCRTAFSNCGYYEYNLKTKKNVKRRGFETLLDAMNVLVFGQDKELEDGFIFDNERLEFLGDAVIGFVITTKLFMMYPMADEGFLATSRSALVRNETLAFLARRLRLTEFILYSHASDVNGHMDVDHALANAMEALMGAVYLDRGAKHVDALMADVLFNDVPDALLKWTNPPVYPLKQKYPFGDRHLIKHISYLHNLTQLEDSIGVHFTHIRILARVFTKRCIGDNFLTLGDNQTLEFLGDSVLQLAITVRLYMMFPYHNEGNLSLLRSCLVSNHTQSLICDDLALEQYIIIPEGYEAQLFTCGDVRKDKADLMEAFLGALYVDKGLEASRHFCDICYFPRLKRFIISQTWNDPKSLLQQCCLLLRSKVGEKPQVPVYKLLNQLGPTNTRQYVVGVYIASNRLAAGVGSNIKKAEMDAASEAVLKNSHLFPIATVAKSLYYLKSQEGKERKRPHQ